MVWYSLREKRESCNDDERAFVDDVRGGGIECGVHWRLDETDRGQRGGREYKEGIWKERQRRFDVVGNDEEQVF